MSFLKNALKKCLLWAGVEQPATSHAEKLISALGAFVGIAGVYFISNLFLGQQAAMMMVASMGASAVLLFAVPHGALSQPWPLVAGHLVSALIGVTCQRWLPGSLWSAPLAVGLAVGAMYYLRCIHPPGGATALTAVLGGEAIGSLGYGFLLFPVGLNVASILALAILFNSPFAWRRYPGHFATRHKPVAANSSVSHSRLTQEDFAAAMQELNSLIDVTPDDLAELFERASEHAERNAVHPADIIAGRFYSNGRLGQQWSVRQVIDAPQKAGAGDRIIYKVIAGDGAYETGLCRKADFRLWARFEVVPSNGHWLRIDAKQPQESSAPTVDSAQ